MQVLSAPSVVSGVTRVQASSDSNFRFYVAQKLAKKTFSYCRGWCLTSEGYRFREINYLLADITNAVYPGSGKLNAQALEFKPCCDTCFGFAKRNKRLRGFIVDQVKQLEQTNSSKQTPTTKPEKTAKPTKPAKPGKQTQREPKKRQQREGKQESKRESKQESRPEAEETIKTTVNSLNAVKRNDPNNSIAEVTKPKKTRARKRSTRVLMSDQIVQAIASSGMPLRSDRLLEMLKTSSVYLATLCERLEQEGRLISKRRFPKDKFWYALPEQKEQLDAIVGDDLKTKILGALEAKPLYIKEIGEKLDMNYKTGSNLCRMLRALAKQEILAEACVDVANIHFHYYALNQPAHKRTLTRIVKRKQQAFKFQRKSKAKQTKRSNSSKRMLQQ
jgi:hypothetical protein